MIESLHREIVFRGKRIDNGEWVYGDLIQQKYGTVVSIVNLKGYKDEVYLKTVGQFTGLKDRNGKNIYLGLSLDFGEGVSFI